MLNLTSKLQSLILCACAVPLSACGSTAGGTDSAAGKGMTPGFFSTVTAAGTRVSSIGPSCTGGNGPLTVKVSAVRASGISPLLVFFNATGTTDTSVTGKTTVFQDVYFTWDFGDTGASGTGTWAYGSNPGKNSQNTATGGVAAHLYVTPGADTAYTVTVTAHDGTNTASCQLGVTAYDPAGANGFAGTKTTCVSASGTPTPGSEGCPVGAAVLSTSNFKTALSSSNFGSGRRMLFKCGDTFTGDNAAASGVKWSIGAYGSCVGTQTGRPIFSDTASSGNPMINIGGRAGDGRVSDLDLEAVSGGSNGIMDTTFNVGGQIQVSYQMTIDNVLANGTSTSFGYTQGAQWGIINSVQTGQHGIGVYLNYNENNPPYTGNTVNNTDYAAVLGDSFDGTGAPNAGEGVEVLRISACRGCVIENTTSKNANNIGGVLKMHEGNTNLSCMASSVTPCNPPCRVGSSTWPSFVNTNCWVGIYDENIEVSDNLFTGTSGANMVEFAPQSNSADERMRNIVIERNIFNASVGAPDGRMLVIAGVNITARDNIFYVPSGATNPPYAGLEAYQRGLEPVASDLEIYNNTCYWLAYQTGGTANTCVGFDTLGDGITPAQNSFIKNNLFYVNHAWTTFINSGTGNTESNNTATSTLNPAITNASGTLGYISDFKPTANYSGGTEVPVWYDALGVPWPPTWDLGAVHH
jgi:hypothetical protein